MAMHLHPGRVLSPPDMTSRALSVRLSEQVTLSNTHYYADCGLHLQVRVSSNPVV